MSSSTSPRSTVIGCSLNSGSSSRARSPSERTSCAALRVLRSATSSMARSSPRAGSAAQRRSSVSRQATVAVSGERRSCDRLLTLSRRNWSSRRSASHCERSRASMALKAGAQLHEFVARPPFAHRRVVDHRGAIEAVALRARHRVAQIAQRPRHGDDDPCRGRGQHHDQCEQARQAEPASVLRTTSTRPASSPGGWLTR